MSRGRRRRDLETAELLMASAYLGTLLTLVLVLGLAV